MILREKTFAFCCFEISKGINFREKGPKTLKTRKFLPEKVSALKVYSVVKIYYENLQNCETSNIFDSEDIFDLQSMRSKFGGHYQLLMSF